MAYTTQQYFVEIGVPLAVHTVRQSFKTVCVRRIIDWGGPGWSDEIDGRREKDINDVMCDLSSNLWFTFHENTVQLAQQADE